MPKIEIVSEKRDYDKYLKIDEAIVKETSESGEEKTYNRYALTRPAAVAVLVYNSSTDTIVLVEQHRYPVQVQGGFGDKIIEIPAGKIDDGEDPMTAAIREVKEEVGYDITKEKMLFFSEYFPSPGYSSEVVYLFAAHVSDEDKTSEGGGVDGENENIIIHNVLAPEFFNMITSGKIIDGKTIMGANYLWHLRNEHIITLGKQYQEILRNQENIKKEDDGEQ